MRTTQTDELIEAYVVSHATEEMPLSALRIAQETGIQLTDAETALRDLTASKVLFVKPMPALPGKPSRPGYYSKDGRKKAAVNEAAGKYDSTEKTAQSHTEKKITKEVAEKAGVPDPEDYVDADEEKDAKVQGNKAVEARTEKDADKPWADPEIRSKVKELILKGKTCGQIATKLDMEFSVVRIVMMRLYHDHELQPKARPDKTNWPRSRCGKPFETENGIAHHVGKCQKCKKIIADDEAAKKTDVRDVAEREVKEILNRKETNASVDVPPAEPAKIEAKVASMDEFEWLTALVHNVRRICLALGCEVATEIHDDPPRATIALVAKGASP